MGSLIALRGLQRGELSHVDVEKLGRSLAPALDALASGGDVVNVPLEAFAGERGTLITPHMANVPHSRPERSIGTLSRGFARHLGTHAYPSQTYT